MLDLKKIRQECAIDLKKEVEGVWFPLTSIPGVDVKVARAGNPRHEKAAQRLMKPYLKSRRFGKDLPPEVQDRIETDLILDTILIDWRGMPGEGGQEAPYSKELAAVLLRDPEFKIVKEEIGQCAEELDAYKKEEEEELEKN